MNLYESGRYRLPQPSGMILIRWMLTVSPVNIRGLSPTDRGREWSPSLYSGCTGPVGTQTGYESLACRSCIFVTNTTQLSYQSRATGQMSKQLLVIQLPLYFCMHFLASCCKLAECRGFRWVSPKVKSLQRHGLHAKLFEQTWLDKWPQRVKSKLAMLTDL